MGVNFSESNSLTSTEADPGIFARRGPESTDDHMFNAGGTKLLYQQKGEGTPQKNYIVEYAVI